ncbi:hypothetical protein [Salipaludibacillus aurantiacus]|uniref:Uncharacterized protein n=1 Tax=Salipaludibacillus aurantiacus TaxID=1601833 RepID=A0A1H9RXI9_9BACI|nr:hypothetical protein [Salipaludibacillus aurantiacus]SER76609.1 hypothetical protein SAMN05518684_103355 [Salipaludibacillus aurantiacus]
MVALKLKEMSKQERINIIIVFALLGAAVAVGIFVGTNEEWIASRNFTAGYMAGSLLAAVVLFSIYRSIAFIFEKMGGSHKK